MNNKIVNVSSLALELNVSVQLLQYLSEHSASYYFDDLEPKKDGGSRPIAKPARALKIIQKSINKNILSRLPVSVAVHGWVKKRSRITCARFHVDKLHFYWFDIDSFFDSIRSERVYRLFNRDLGFSPDVSSILTKLTTYKYCLPQGSPCSPAIANFILYPFDQSMRRYSKQRNANYSRFGDDILFSSGKRLVGLEQLIKKRLSAFGLRINSSKKILDANTRRGAESVLGLIISRKLSISKKERRLLRAIVYNKSKMVGIENSEYSSNNTDHLRGKIAQIQILHPDLGEFLLKELESVN